MDWNHHLVKDEVVFSSFCDVTDVTLQESVQKIAKTKLLICRFGSPTIRQMFF